MHKSGMVNRQIGAKNFIRVVILDPRQGPTRLRGHVIQRMRNPKTDVVSHVQPSSFFDNCYFGHVTVINVKKLPQKFNYSCKGSE